MNEKGFFSSKLNILGLVTFLVSLFSFLQGNEFVQQYPKAVSIIGTALGVLIIVLRLLTNEPVSVKKMF